MNEAASWLFTSEDRQNSDADERRSRLRDLFAEFAQVAQFAQLAVLLALLPHQLNLLLTLLYTSQPRSISRRR